MSEPILKLTGVTKTYNEGASNQVSVLNGVDLVVPPGEVAALIAPSGAGKSTLLHIAGLLESPSAGQVEIAGTDLSRANDRERTAARRDEIGFVYQFHHLLPEFSAAENIALPQSRRSSSGRAVRWRTTAGCAVPGFGEQATAVAGG